MSNSTVSTVFRQPLKDFINKADAGLERYHKS